MDARTRRYLAGRFRDHYRRTTVASPPAAHRREWGYIPWDDRPGTTMVRHRSLADMGDIESFLQYQQPRHVYYSAGRYRDPAAARMAEKGWDGADLIFDLDADHLPTVTADDDYGTMLAKCKTELQSLLRILQEDFAFTDLTTVFSGGRGYHVHVRDVDIRDLARESRREIVDYVRGNGIDLEYLVETREVAGVGRQTPATTRRVDTDRGWSRRIHTELLQFVDELADSSESAAIDRLESIDGIGEQRARTLASVIDRSYDEIRGGNIDVHPAFSTLARAMVERATVNQGAAIDEPVTTDVNRLIRLPESLHGGSGLVVRPIPLESLDLFDPLVHAIPQTFRGQEITIELREATSVGLGGTIRDLGPGIERVPEYVGIHLMATDRAEKVRETGR